MELCALGKEQRFFVLRSFSLASGSRAVSPVGAHVWLSLTCGRGGSHCSQVSSDPHAVGLGG